MSSLHLGFAAPGGQMCYCRFKGYFASNSCQQHVFPLSNSIRQSQRRKGGREGERERGGGGGGHATLSNFVTYQYNTTCGTMCQSHVPEYGALKTGSPCVEAFAPVSLSYHHCPDRSRNKQPVILLELHKKHWLHATVNKMRQELSCSIKHHFFPPTCSNIVIEYVSWLVESIGITTGGHFLSCKRTGSLILLLIWC